MEIKSSHPEKFTRTLLARTIQTMLLGFMAITSSHAATIKNEPVNHTARYLDPSIWNITVNQNECFLAGPHSMLQIEPVITNGVRVYKISQFFDETRQKELYAQPIDDQIKNHKIVGREFCNGIVSLSNMDIPFVKNQTQLDANDGLLFIDAIRHKTAEVQDQLGQMQALAIQASSGIYSSNQLSDFDKVFQAHLNSIEQIAQTTRFHGVSLFNGSSLSLDVALNGSLALAALSLLHSKSDGFISIPLSNFTTGSPGLNIAALHIDSSWGAQEALNSVTSITEVNTEFSNLNAVSVPLEVLAKQTTHVTQVDVTTDDFVVQHQTSLIHPQKSHV